MSRSKIRMQIAILLLILLLLFLIAATALVHELTVVTRNQADFRVAGVKLVDPFG